MSRKVTLLCAAAIAAGAAVAIAGNHSDKPITPGFASALNRLCEGRINLTWALEVDEAGQVSGIIPCGAPTSGLNFELDVFGSTPPDDTLPDGTLTIAPPETAPPIVIRINNPDAFVFEDRDGNPLMLVPAR